MALIEVYREAWVYCSCGDQERLIGGGGMKLTGHQFLVAGQEEPTHQTEVVYEMDLMVLSGTMWAASATSDDL